MAVFGDLNILWGNNISESDDRIVRAIEYGYEVVVVNNFVPELSIKTGKKQQNKGEDVIVPSKILEVAETDVRNSGRSVRLLSRFSTVLSDPDQVIRLQKDPVVQSYDIISVRPTTEKLFLNACQDLEVDIISLDMTTYLNFQLKHTAVGCALKRGIHFEIVYAPVLRDPSVIKNMMFNMLQLLDTCRGKNIIISSGCKKSFELREPYSVLSLGSMFGLTDEHAKSSITTNCRSVLLHAAARKSAKGVLSIINVSCLAPGDEWKKPTDPIADAKEVEEEEEKREKNTDEDVKCKREEDDDECPPSKRIKLDSLQYDADTLKMVD